MFRPRLPSLTPDPKWRRRQGKPQEKVVPAGVPVAIVAQLVRALVCGTRGRGFKSPRSPHFFEPSARKEQLTSMTTPWGLPDFDAHEQIHFVTDEKCGLKAIIAIHSTHLGPAA